MSEDGVERQHRCTWCGLPREDCVCDSPDFDEHGRCGSCGNWVRTSKLFDETASGTVEHEVCDRCATTTTDGGRDE